MLQGQQGPPGMGPMQGQQRTPAMLPIQWQHGSPAAMTAQGQSTVMQLAVPPMLPVQVTPQEAPTDSSEDSFVLSATWKWEQAEAVLKA